MPGLVEWSSLFAVFAQHAVEAHADDLMTAFFGGFLNLGIDRHHIGALRGTPATRAQDVLAAGCDVVLHCNGDLAEMRQVAAVVPGLNGAAAVRWRRALAVLRPPQPMVEEELRARLELLLRDSERQGDGVCDEDPTARGTPALALAAGG